MTPTRDPVPPPGSPPPSRSELPRLSVQELFNGRSEIILDHNGEDYRLRITARGRLILTK